MAWYVWLDKNRKDFYSGSVWPAEGEWTENIQPLLNRNGWHVFQTTAVADMVPTNHLPQYLWRVEVDGAHHTQPKEPLTAFEKGRLEKCYGRLDYDAARRVALAWFDCFMTDRLMPSAVRDETGFMTLSLAREVQRAAHHYLDGTDPEALKTIMKVPNWNFAKYLCRCLLAPTDKEAWAWAMFLQREMNGVELRTELARVLSERLVNDNETV